MQHPWREYTLTATRSSPDAPLRVRSVAYGYGLGISRDCHFSHIVGLGGGLPGFGSYMMWLPDYGVVLFAMTNLTYAGPAAALAEAFEILEGTGALKPRELPPSPALASSRRVTRFSDCGATGMIARPTRLQPTTCSSIRPRTCAAGESRR